MKKAFIIAFLFLSFFALSSCSDEKNDMGQSSSQDFKLFLNSKEISDEKNFFKEKDSLFLSLDLIENIFDSPDTEQVNDKIKTKIDIKDFIDDKELCKAFHSEKIYFTIPCVDYKDRYYVNTKFLKDFFDFSILEFQDVYFIFTGTSKDKKPNATALLPKGSSIYEKNKDEYTLFKESDKNLEIYIAEYPFDSKFDYEKEDLKLLTYSPDFGIKYISAFDIENCTVWNEEKKSIKISNSRDKYKAIQMSWDVYESYSSFILQAPKIKIQGLDILSPSCFSFVEDELQCIMSHEYASSAKDLGYLLYGHFTNSKDPDIIKDAIPDSIIKDNKDILIDTISKEDKMNEMVDLLLFYSLYYGFDGLNIDFVNLIINDRDDFTYFFSDLAERAHKLGLGISLCVPTYAGNTVERTLRSKDLVNSKPKEESINDINIESGQFLGNGFIDFPKIQSSVDFFVLMAMDQYPSGLKISGPVASCKWVERNIKDLISLVPPEKIVLAQATYLRVYCMDKKFQYVDSNFLCSDDELRAKINGRTVDYLYDELAEQNVYQFRDIEKPIGYRVWVEDEKSLKKKLNFVDEYGLKGYATWDKNREPDWYRELKNEVLSDER